MTAAEVLVCLGTIEDDCDAGWSVRPLPMVIEIVPTKVPTATSRAVSAAINFVTLLIGYS